MKRISQLDSQNKVLTFWFALALAATLAVGCTSLTRSTQSGYANRDQEPNLGRDRRATEKLATMRELGFADESDLSRRDEAMIYARTKLTKAERALEGKREREQYFRNKPFMRSDRERLEFLSLENYDERQRWLNAKGIHGSTTPHAPEIQALVDINDITVGMTKNAVRDSWGEPELVEVAGNPIYGNERWHYSEQTSSTEGYRTQQRLVYFESGRVVGWESR